MKALLGAACLALVVVLAAAPPAGAAKVVGWDGSNPFDCVIQNVGTGTNFPEPNADPFCVEFDKRHQNVTELGVVDFLSQEPARVAAAGPKCFYFQRDHWRGSIVQGDESTKTYEWDGSYFFDKARGLGGVYVEHATFNGQTYDPTTLPGFPAEYKPYFGYGRGGTQVADSVQVDPSCVAKAKAKSPLAGSASKPCLSRRGSVGRGIGGVTLGDRQSKIVGKLGPPARARRGFSRWCITGGGALKVGFPLASAAAAAPSPRAQIIVTTSKRFSAAGVHVGSSTRTARTRLHSAKTSHRPHGFTLLHAKLRGRQLVLGLRGGQVRYVAVASRRLSLARLDRYLARSR